MITDDEKLALLLLAETYNKLSALPHKHPSDMDDVLFHIHALQRIVMSREAVRNNQGFFTPGETS